jgi:hypothetical protein
MDYGEPRVVRMAVVRGNPLRHVATLSDGRQVSVPTDSDAYADTIQLAVTSLDTVSRSLEIHTTRGDDVVLEMPALDGRSRRNGRKAVYLDQNHRSTLATAIYEPEVVRSSEREAARTVIQLAQNQQIVLPMSFVEQAEHLAESCTRAVECW